MTPTRTGLLDCHGKNLTADDFYRQDRKNRRLQGLRILRASLDPRFRTPISSSVSGRQKHHSIRERCAGLGACLFGHAPFASDRSEWR